MPLIARCDAPGCDQQCTIEWIILGRPQVPGGWSSTSLAGHGGGRPVIACSAAHLVAAADAVRARPVSEPFKDIVS